MRALYVERLVNPNPPSSDTPPKTAKLIAVGAPKTDPVCGMKVRPDTHRVVEHQGKKFYFCSDGCMSKFNADPERYLQPRTAAAMAMPAELPIDPVCGMKVDPRTQRTV